jgi:hypothetical protein
LKPCFAALKNKPQINPTRTKGIPIATPIGVKKYLEIKIIVFFIISKYNYFFLNSCFNFSTYNVASINSS